MAIDITHSLREFLISNAAISALVSSRVYTDQAPSGQITSGKLPQIVLELDDADRLRYFEDRNTLARTDLTINCYDDSRSDLVDLMATIRGELDHYRGTLGAAEASTVRGIFFTEDRLQRMHENDGGEWGTFHAELEITVRHVEA